MLVVQQLKHTVDGCEILHQLVDGVSHWTKNKQSHYLQCFIVTNSCQLVQDFFHPQYEPIEDIILPQINSHV